MSNPPVIIQDLQTNQVHIQTKVVAAHTSDTRETNLMVMELPQTDGVKDKSIARIRFRDALTGTSHSSSAIDFQTATVEDEKETTHHTLTLVDGNVGIGTTTPEATLHVKAGEGLVQPYPPRPLTANSDIVTDTEYGTGLYTTNNYAVFDNNDNDTIALSVSNSFNITLTNNTTITVNGYYTLNMPSSILVTLVRWYRGEDGASGTQNPTSIYILAADDPETLQWDLIGSTTNTLSARPFLIDIPTNPSRIYRFYRVAPFGNLDFFGSNHVSTITFYGYKPNNKVILDAGNVHVNGSIFVGETSTIKINERFVMVEPGVVRGTDDVVHINRTTIGGTTRMDRFIRFRSGGSPIAFAGIQLSSYDTDHFYMFAMNNNLMFQHLNTLSDTRTLNQPIGNTLLTLNSTGNVGIGTTTPEATLHIQRTDGTYPELYLDSAGGQKLSLLTGSTFSVLGYTSSFQLGTITGANYAGFSEKIRITSTGNVGIGTGNPSQRLHVIGNILASGTITPSDDRIKYQEQFITNVTPILLKLRPQLYLKANSLKDVIDGEYIVTTNEDGTTTTTKMTRESGFIAQEIYYDTPELRHLVHLPSDIDETSIVDPPNNYYESRDDPSIDPDWSAWGDSTASLNYMGLIAYLIQGFKEQEEKIIETKGELSATQTELQQEKEKVSVLESQIEQQNTLFQDVLARLTVLEQQKNSSP